MKPSRLTLSIGALAGASILLSMSAIDVSDPIAIVTETEPVVSRAEPLRARTLKFSAVIRPDGRTQLLSILNLSGMLTVGDVLTPQNIKTLFSLTEQNYASIV